MNVSFLFGRFQRIKWLQPSVIALIAANLAPLAAIYIFHWDVFSLLFLFWLENVLFGVFNVLKMLLAGVGAKDLPPYGAVIFWVLKLFLIPFFCLHYGFATYIHGIFVVGIFDQGAHHNFGELKWPLIVQMIRDHGLEWPFAGLAISHLVSFGWDYLWKGEFRHTNPMELMTQPYRRVAIMHVTIIVGAFLTLTMHLPEAALIFLVLLKTAIDLWGHQNEREKSAAAASAAAAESPVPEAGPLPPTTQAALTAALQQRMLSQPGQRPPLRSLIPVTIVVTIIAIFFACFLGFFAWQFVSIVFSQPRPITRPPRAAADPWTLDLSSAKFPKSLPAGRIHGVITHMDRGLLGNGILTLHEGPGRMANTFVVNLPADNAESLANRSFRIATNDVAGVPEIKMSWHDYSPGPSPPVFTTEVFTNGYAMRLEFGALAKNKMPVRIYLCLPDAQKDFLAGTLKVTIKRDEVSAESAGN